MELTSAALWLNTAFAGYDKAILSLMHFLQSILGVVLTPLMKLVTLLGEKGALMFLLGLVLMCFKKTRKMGICVFGAVGCGAIITNFILKDAVARPRPFETVALFKTWWQAVGSPAEDGFSFPSGHVTAISAAMVSLWLFKGKKFTLPAVGTILLMMVSRNYLMAHYPSDVLAALLVGTLAAFIAYGITIVIYNILYEFDDIRICNFVLEFDLGELINSKTGGEGIKLSRLREIRMPKINVKDVKLPRAEQSGYKGKHLK